MVGRVPPDFCTRVPLAAAPGVSSTRIESGLARVPAELRPLTPRIADDTDAGTVTSRAGACRSCPPTRYWWMAVPKALAMAASVPRTVIACSVLPTTFRPAPVAHAVTAWICADVAPNRAWYCAGLRNCP